MIVLGATDAASDVESIVKLSIIDGQLMGIDAHNGSFEISAEVTSNGEDWPTYHICCEGP